MWIAPPESPVKRPRGESGQAAASFVAILPLLLAAVVLVGQLAVVGYAAWSAAGAARAGARAGLVGDPVALAARAALPDPLSRRSRVIVDEPGGEVRVEIDAPRLLPLIPALSVDSAAALPIGGLGGG